MGTDVWSDSINAFFCQFKSRFVVIELVIPSIWKFSDSKFERIGNEPGVEHINEEITAYIT